MASNYTAWSDGISLIKRTVTVDSDGYETYTESTREVFCNWNESVSRSEFYEAYKAGIQLSATADVNFAEYENEKFADYGTRHFRIVRTFPSGFNTVRLVLEEIMI